jgi:hypothetical protein
MDATRNDRAESHFAILNHGSGGRSGQSGPWKGFGGGEKGLKGAFGVFLVIACFSSLGPAGCASDAEVDAQVAALQARLDQQRAILETAINQQQTRLEALPEGSPDRDEVGQQLDHVRHVRDAVRVAQGQLDLVRRVEADPAGAAEGGISALVPFLPAPAQLPLLLGTGMIAAMLRARQMKSALGSVVRGLDTAMKDDAEFRKKFKEHAPTFRAFQTKAAARVVDEVTNDRFMLRLPM